MMLSGQSIFIERIHAHFQLQYQSENDICYYYWVGKREIVIEYFQKLTFPSIATIGQTRSLSDELIVFTASPKDQQTLIGTAILTINLLNQMEVLCFTINQKYRKQGHAKSMLHQIEHFAKKRNIKELGLLFRTYWDDNTEWEGLLENMGWTQQFVRQWYFYISDVINQFDKPWFKKMILPKMYEIEIWNENTFSELEETLSQPEWKGAYPKELNPFQLKELILLRASLLLKKEGELVGWLACHLIEPNLLQATALFVHPTKARGLGLLLIAKSMECRKVGYDVVFAVQKSNTTMFNLAQKYILNKPEDLSVLKERRKILDLL